MKPRIYMQSGVWFCEGPTICECGATPEEAYCKWMLEAIPPGFNSNLECDVEPCISDFEKLERDIDKHGTMYAKLEYETGGERMVKVSKKQSPAKSEADYSPMLLAVICLTIGFGLGACI